jgi:dCMP deaminase
MIDNAVLSIKFIIIDCFDSGIGNEFKAIITGGSCHIDFAIFYSHTIFCVRTTHAEANAIVQAAKNGVGIKDGEIYVTASPCYNCFKLIANSGIKTIYYDEFYREDRIINHAKEAGIELINLD